MAYNYASLSLLLLILSLSGALADLVLTDQYFVDVTSIDTGVVSKVPYAPLVKGTSGQPRDGFNNVPLVSSGASANKPCDAALLSTPAFVAGKIVLIYDYSCFPSINAAVVAVKAAGAAAAIWCFEHMPKTPLPMQHVGISATYTNFTVWSMRTDRDCAPIHSSLLAGSNLTMSMVGSGTIDPNEKLALKAIARGMMGTASWALEAINRPWTDYVTNDADPCQFPLQGIWCENGHVVAVYFVVNGCGFASAAGMGSAVEIEIYEDESGRVVLARCRSRGATSPICQC